ncbi:MAG: hypothetical protein V4592_11570 [Bacteroidota bacterium]
MKKLILIALLAGWGHAFAQKRNGGPEFKEHISKQFTLQKPAAGSVFALYNVFGGVKVEGYSGNQVVIEIDETIMGDKAEDVELAKKEFKLGFDQKADSIIAYTAAPYDSRPHDHGYHNDGDHNRHYIVKLEYTVKVPNNIYLRVSTVNDGDMYIKDVYGALNVYNVNGPITIVNAKSTTVARTVNGPVTVNYLSIPQDASSYYTVNGKMEVTYPSNFEANLQFKSMNGQFFTDFPDTEVLPTEIVKTENKNNNGTTYKMNKNTAIRVGKGGKLFKFETLNGNIYIKKA